MIFLVVEKSDIDFFQKSYLERISIFYNNVGLLAKTLSYMYFLVIAVEILTQFGQCAYAISGYDSGYNHGCDDAKIADQSERYINQP